MPAVLAMGSVPHTILGSALSLLLVFRTNSSYGRLVEGRRVRPAQLGSATLKAQSLKQPCSHIKDDSCMAASHWSTSGKLPVLQQYL